MCEKTIRRALALLAAVLAAVLQGPAAAAAPDPAGDRAWPVGDRPAVVHGWDPPATPYGAGHRGVDLAAAPGTAVRAAAGGTVSFAGRVAGRGVLSVELSGSGDPPLRTTYEPVRAVVDEGDEVAAGEVVAILESGPFHCPAACLHWGLLRGETYLDPLGLLPPWMLRRGPSRLLPVFGVPELRATREPAPLGAVATAGPVDAVQAALLALMAALAHRQIQPLRRLAGSGGAAPRGGLGAEPPVGARGEAPAGVQGAKPPRPTHPGVRGAAPGFRKGRGGAAEISPPQAPHLSRKPPAGPSPQPHP
ncbi:peptidoglycan DD-metalloendopeptidase family protein [Streptomyces sp. TRM66268-LWL]|uniref:Peptidoglycan DD-metalloendopeptidase family protein n=1 Tax=Streptomyces polyasparticus TaxID=2767826 RepID=A0ABR7SB03_9ACTN|nr:peptidoglycan DD-metalloendopeptidase family protein [Streptomyces polyasparticus]